MPIRVLCLVAVAVLAVVPGQAGGVTIDYDHEVDLGRFKTFAYRPSGDHLADSELMDERIVAALESMLKEGGLSEADTGAALNASYHVKTEQQQSFTTVGTGYGVGPGWRTWGGINTSTTMEQTWTEGTLIVDLWDPERKKAVWRATAVTTLSKSPEKQARKIEKMFQKILEKWQKIRSE